MWTLSWFPRGSDLLVYFFELSIRLLKTKGINAFITQNSWLSTESGKKFQGYLLENTNMHSIIDSDYKYFETANINAIITFSQGQNKQHTNIAYVRTHKSFIEYPVPAFKFDKVNNNCDAYKTFDPRKNDMKWGVLLKDDVYLGLLNIIDSKGKKISELDDFSIGQGLNLKQKKKCIFTGTDLVKFGISKDAAYPFYNKMDGANYYWNQASSYIVDAKKCDSNHSDHILYDFSHTTKEPPVLIIPRGIGDKHYCCYNAINGYSDSYVDVYSKNGLRLTDDVLRLWIYFNSSIFWLIRENSGRTNLGGGTAVPQKCGVIVGSEPISC